MGLPCAVSLFDDGGTTMTEGRRYPEDGDTMDAVTERPPAPDDATCLDDTQEVRRWITLLREQVDQGFGAAEDATRPVRERVFSRHEARRRIEHAEKLIRNLLDAAEARLSAKSSHTIE
jgi:hypothetical protein